MKNRKKTQGSIYKLILLLVLILNFGCNKNEFDSKTGKFNPNGDFYFLNQKYLTSYNLKKEYKKSLNKHTKSENISNTGIYYNVSGQITDLDLNDIITDVQNYFGGDIDQFSETPLAAVTYTNSHYSNTNLTNIKGISIFYLNQDDILTHKLFVFENSSSYEHEDFTSTIKGYSTTDLVVLREMLVGTADTSTYFKFETQEFIGSWIEFQGNSKLSKLIVLSDETPEIPTLPNDCPPSECPSGAGGCVFDEYGGALCDDCTSAEMRYQNIKLNLNIDMDTAIPSAQAYDFRDNFLSNYEIGLLYINRYYQLSYLIRGLDLIDINNFYDHLTIASDLFEIANKLQYGNNNDIIITNEFKDDAIAMLISYKEATPNTNYHNTIDEIIDDLNQFVGLTREDILNSIN